MAIATEKMEALTRELFLTKERCLELECQIAGANDQAASETLPLGVWEREASRLSASRNVAPWPSWVTHESNQATSSSEGARQLNNWPRRGTGGFKRARS